MQKRVLVKILCCIFVFGLLLYRYIDKQNELTQLRMNIPHLAKEVRLIQEENCRLRYEIKEFEDPRHLLELASNTEYSHLKYPLLKEILTVREGNFVQEVVEEKRAASLFSSFPIAIGAKH